MEFRDRQIDTMRIDPPNNADLFEDFCRDLAKVYLNMPSAQRFGRSGHVQNGVDVVGMDENGKMIGIQCKKKDLLLNNELTEADVKKEIQKALKFKPPLNRYIIASTLPRNPDLQTLALSVSLEHRKSNLFSVEIWSWDDIREYLCEADKVMFKYFPEFKPGIDSEAFMEKLDDIAKTGKEILQNQGGGKNLNVEAGSVGIIAQNVTVGNVEINNGSSDEKIWNLKIDNARDMLIKNNPESAIEELEKIKKEAWSMAGDMVKFRIVTNIAVAKIQMQKLEEGAKLFIEALQYNKDDEKALANTAYGYVLLDQKEKGHSFIMKAIKKNPANYRSYAILIQTLDPKLSMADIVKLVPEEYRNESEVAYNFAMFAREKDDFEEASRWLEIANDTEEKKPDIQAAQAEMLLKVALRDPALILAGQIDEKTKEHLMESVRLFDEAWKSVEHTEINKNYAGWLVNRSLANRLLGEIDVAIRDIELALSFDPENPEILKQKSVLAYESGDIKKAINILKDVVAKNNIPDISLMLAGLYKENKEYSEAISILHPFVSQKIEDKKTHEDGLRLLMQLYLDTQQYPLAENINDKMLSESANEILNLVDKARILIAKGESQNALPILKEAKRNISKNSSNRELFELANQFYHLEKFEDAALIYEKIVDMETDSQPLRNLLNSYYRSNKLTEALQICQKIYEKYGPVSFVTEVESAIYESIGDLQKAKEVCQAYVEKFPDDLNMKIRLSVTKYRLNENEELDEFLNSEIDDSKLSFLSIMQLINLFEERGMWQKALDLMYETRRKFFDNEEAHMNYIGVFLRRENEAGDVLNREIAGKDTSVCIEDESKTKKCYILEDRKEPKIEKGEINMSHPLYDMLTGKKKGDTIKIKEGQLSEGVLTIVDVKSKYVYAFQETMSSYKTMFPADDKLQQFYVEDKKDGEMPDGIKKMLDQLGKFNETQLAIEQFYKEGKSTVGSFATLLGKDIINTWGIMVSKPDLGIKAAIGTRDEKLNSIRAIKSIDSPKLIIDVISLLTISHLEIADEVVRVYGKFGIAQSTLDTLRDIIADRKGMGRKGFMTIGKEGESFVRQEITAQQVKDGVEFLDNLLQWTMKNCDVLPCTTALKLDKKEKKLRKMLGGSFFDTILIASEKAENILFSDDERLRSLANNEYGCNGIWTQLLLMDMIARKSISEETYAKATVGLVGLNYNYTSVSKESLAYAIVKSDWKYEGIFFAVLQKLKEGNTDGESAVKVIGEFLDQAWKNVPKKKMEGIIFGIIEVLTEGRDRNIILSKLKLAVDESYSMKPLEKEAIFSYVRKWEKNN
ncbi:MAG: hypothetical protein HGA36_00950 [Candidatus Moranbacteria bacterium]|nr:hypothetical protein [Candidatus Moranbacteria bacterium]